MYYMRNVNRNKNTRMVAQNAELEEREKGKNKTIDKQHMEKSIVIIVSFTENHRRQQGTV